MWPFNRRKKDETITLPAQLYHMSPGGAVSRIDPNSRFGQWQRTAHAMRASFTQNLVQSLMADYTDVSDDLLSRAYIQSVTASACIELNAQAAASVPLMVQDVADEVLDQHPLNDFVDRAAVLLWHISVSQDIWGRAYLRKRRDDYDGLGRLQWLWTPDVEPLTRWDKNGVEHIVAYRYANEPIPAHQVIDLPLFDPSDRLGAVSPLEKVITQVSISRNMAVFTANFFFNGATMSGILKLPGINNEADLRLQQQQFAALHAGARKAWKPFATNIRDAEWVPTSAPPEELAMAELHGITQTDIARAFKVNPVLVGLTDAGDPLSSQNTYDAILADHLRSTIIPRLRMNLTEINEQWAWRDFEPARYYSLAPNLAEMDLLSQITREDVDTTTALWTTGQITLDESRERTGNAPLNGSNGQVVLVNGLLYPVNRLAEVANQNADNVGAQPQLSPFMSVEPIQIETPQPPQLSARAASPALHELDNWRRKVDASTPDCDFYLDALEGHSAAAWLRGALDMREDVTTAFWIARQWIRSGEPPPGIWDF
jgi:HK97 family phage portal protein